MTQVGDRGALARCVMTIAATSGISCCGRRADQRGHLVELGEDGHRGDRADDRGLGEVLARLEREVLRAEEVLEAAEPG